MNIIAIYLSGNRISWLILTVMLIVTIFQYRNSLLPTLKPYILTISVGFIFYVYSQPVEGRYISTFKALVGDIDNKYDSSGRARMDRAQIAINSIIKHPLGTGWGSQGWVHSDVLQIGASTGIIAGLIFFFAPIILLAKVYYLYIKVPPNEKSFFFISSGLLIFVIISLSLNGNILLVQSGAPLMILWAIVEGYRQYYKGQSMITLNDK